MDQRKEDHLLKPAYSQAIWHRHAARVRATRERIELKLVNLRAEKTAIETKINDAPTNRGLFKELREMDNKIAKGNIKLNSQTRRRYLTATHGVPTKRLLGGSRKAGVKSTPHHWASAPKCWLTR
jgi:hypothetical protein